MASGVDLVLGGQRAAGAGAVDAIQGVKRGQRLQKEADERQAEIDKKEEAESIRQQRLADVNLQLEDLTLQAQDRDFDREQFTQAAVPLLQEAGEIDSASTVRSLGQIDKIISDRQKNERAEADRIAKSGTLEEKKRLDTRKEARAKRKELREIGKDFTSNPGTKRTAQMRESFGRIQTATEGKPTAPKDLSLIFNFMKTLDPESVVRESEFKSAAEARSFFSRLPENESGEKVDSRGIPLPASLIQAFQKADPDKAGAFLLPEQREAFRDTAEENFESQLRIQQSVDNRTLEQVRATGASEKEFGQVIPKTAAKDLEEIAQRRKEALAKAEAEKTPIEKTEEQDANTKIISQAQFDVLIQKNEAAFAQRIGAINAKRQAAGQPPLSDDEQGDIIEALLQKQGFRVGGQ